MAILGIINKQPSEILDFDIDYTSTLLAGADSLTTATATVAPSGALTIDATTVDIPNKKVKVKFSGGTTATTYKITVQTNTGNSLKYEDEVNVIVEDV